MRDLWRSCKLNAESLALQLCLLPSPPIDTSVQHEPAANWKDILHSLQRTPKVRSQFLDSEPRKLWASRIRIITTCTGPDPSTNKQTNNKNLDFNCFVTFLWLLTLPFLMNDVNVPPVRKKQKSISTDPIEGSGSVSKVSDPEHSRRRFICAPWSVKILK